MNYVHLLGKISKEPVLSDCEQTCIVKFDVLVSEKYKKNNGEMSENEVTIPCVAWDSGAKVIHKFFKKNHKIIVHGKISTDKSFFVRVKSFEFA
jgi:single-stranded DNA-binding protein